jgi:hypothetical protein
MAILLNNMTLLKKIYKNDNLYFISTVLIADKVHCF